MADAPTYPPLPPKRELGMGLMYEPVEGFNADDMRAFVDADRAARAAQPQPSQPLTDAQVGDLCGEANRGYCIESEHYFKAFRDAEEAHGITGQATPPSPPVAAPPATPEPFAFVQEMWDELARQGHSEHDMRRWSKALTALESAQPQPQPAHPLTGADHGGMTIVKALRMGLRAEVWLDGGAGPKACVGICAIQLQGWTHTADTAKAWADAYNRAIDNMRAAYALTAPSTLPQPEVAP